MAEREKSFFYGYIVVALSCLLLLVFQGIYYSFGIFLKPLASEFGWTRAIISGAFSLCTVFYGFLFIFTGRLNDRFGPRAVVTVGGLFLGLGYILMSQIEAIWQLYLFFGIIVAIGMSGGFVPLVSTASKWFSERRGLMSSIVLSGAGLGTLVMPPISSLLLSNYGWRTAYISLGAGALAIIIVGAQFLRYYPAKEEPSQGSSKTDELGIREVLKNKQFLILSSLSFADGYFVFIIMTHLVPHATDLGIAEGAAASLLAIIGGLNVIGRISGGALADRIGAKKTLLGSFILTSLALSMLLFITELWSFYLFAFLIGLGSGGLIGVKPTLVASLFGLKSHGGIYGLNIFITYTGGAIGATLAGRLFDTSGSYFTAFSTCIFASLSALILTALLKTARERR